MLKQDLARAIHRPRIVQATVPFAHAMQQYMRGQLDSATRAYSRRQRAWHTPTRYSIFEGYGRVLNPDGSVALLLDPVPNALTNEGQTNMLNVYLKGTTQTANWRLLLLSNAAGGQGASAPAKTSTAAVILVSGSATQAATNVYEENGGGYARQTITQANWGTPALNGGDEMSTAAQQTFGPATGAAWTGVGGSGSGSTAITYAAISTGTATTGDATGVLVLYVALSASTIIAVGQSFNYTLNFKQT